LIHKFNQGKNLSYRAEYARIKPGDVFVFGTEFVYFVLKMTESDQLLLLTTKAKTIPCIVNVNKAQTDMFLIFNIKLI